MIKNPTEEIVFMNVMTLLCEYTGLRADKAYSIEHKETQVSPMTLNENYTNIYKILEKVFKKEFSINFLVQELEKILKIEINYEKSSDKNQIQWEEIKNFQNLMQYISCYID